MFIFVVQDKCGKFMGWTFKNLLARGFEATARKILKYSSHVLRVSNVTVWAFSSCFPYSSFVFAPFLYSFLATSFLIIAHLPFPPRPVVCKKVFVCGCVWGRGYQWAGKNQNSATSLQELFLWHRVGCENILFEHFPTPSLLSSVLHSCW